MKSLLIGAILGLCVFQISCGNSRRGNPTAKYCVSDWEGIGLTNPEANKNTKIDDSTVLDLKEGEYEIRSFQMYIIDPERDIRMHIEASIDRNEDNDLEVNDLKLLCVGGKIHQKMEPFVYSLPIVNKIQVSASGKTTLSEGFLTLDYRDRGNEVWPVLHPEWDNKTSDKSLKNTFEGFDVRNMYLVEYGNSYELRNKLSEEIPPASSGAQPKSRSVQSLMNWKRLQ